VRVCRELASAASERCGPWAGRLATLSVAVTLAFASLHGLRSYAVGNPAGLVYPYFGTPHRHLMIDDAKRLLPDHDLLFVNAGILSHAIGISLYEPGRATGRPFPYDFVTMREEDDRLEGLLHGGRKNCFIYLNDEQHTWVAQKLRTRLPGGDLVEGRGGNHDGPPLYFLYFFPVR
jgi:hypothetical protein